MRRMHLIFIFNIINLVLAEPFWWNVPNSALSEGPWGRYRAARGRASRQRRRASCGIVERGRGFVVGGVAARVLPPWHVGLYRGDEYICGGTIINARTVLTAAHCVTQADRLHVAAGKRYREFHSPRDAASSVQRRSVTHVHVHPSYSGDACYFKADVALLRLDRPLRFSPRVGRACVGGPRRLAGLTGHVAGWGNTRLDALGDPELQQLAVPIHPADTCFSNVPPSFASFLNPADKICAGYFNGSRSVCTGDSGGGLVLRRRDGRHYLEGLVSVGVPLTLGTRSTCDHNQITLYTRVSAYLDFVKLADAWTGGDAP